MIPGEDRVYERCRRRQVRQMLLPTWGQHAARSLTVEDVTEMVVRALVRSREAWSRGEVICGECGQRHVPLV